MVCTNTSMGATHQNNAHYYPYLLCYLLCYQNVCCPQIYGVYRSRIYTTNLELRLLCVLLVLLEEDGPQQLWISGTLSSVCIFIKMLPAMQDPITAIFMYCSPSTLLWGGKIIDFSECLQQERDDFLIPLLFCLSLHYVCC